MSEQDQQWHPKPENEDAYRLYRERNRNFPGWTNVDQFDQIWAQEEQYQSLGYPNGIDACRSSGNDPANRG